MRQELLFEIGTEEIPAGYIAPALANMHAIMATKLNELDLSFKDITTVATPRRLTICVSELASRQEDRREEVLGPPKKAAFAGDKPTKAAEGFAKSRGVSVDQLQIASTDKGEYIMVVVEKKGEETINLLPDLLNAIIKEMPFPKSMRWGAGRTSFARPIQWLLAIYNDQIVPCQANDVTSDKLTYGHRFMSPSAIEITDFTSYLHALRQAKVLADPSERREAANKEITRAAATTVGKILPDEELLDTVTNLVESPFAICGSFDEKFLELPREALITSMREHQKYFAVVNDKGDLLPYFVAVNNTETKDPIVAKAGHQRVLRARLEDALFFFHEDKNKKMVDRIDDLSGVIFQSGLGTMLEKTERIEKLAGTLANKLAPELTVNCQKAARLAKADLLTAMVNEFPSLQGVMGRVYALQEGENPEVAAAITEHYLPIRAGGELPVSVTGALVSLADRIDTIAGCFGIGKLPTGTTDPYGLRRLTLGLLYTISDKGFNLSLSAMTDEALNLYQDKITEDVATAKQNIMEFIKGRYVNDRIAGGIPIETVEAVTSTGFDDVAECNLKISALTTISKEPAFPILAGSFKRVRNIIKEHQDTKVAEELLTEGAEKRLFAALQQAEKDTTPLLANRNYLSAMAVILQMKEPVDNFFDDVMVMAEDDKVKNNRLALLTAISKLFLKIGDFSKMTHAGS
ncbi:MAG: glycine--tRNA ligase subunit beta [Proteobacteria bacterium]|nr:glycine--tRNA ligase subunit beta [Pseudomonadota bacterium]MBU1716991.1 glycine--tRNA ligase subunit beta [Pseudomonadota bacterium]